MGYSANSAFGYGVELSRFARIDIESYLEEHDPQYVEMGEAWWYYLQEVKFADIKGFKLHSDGVDYRFHAPVPNGMNFYIGVSLWGSTEALLKEALTRKLVVPAETIANWERILAFLQECGIREGANVNTLEPSFFSYTYTS